ncbi:hypothetical protein BBP40_004342 [Aspergillus hancockii]|nr:hypothetical protein BBP40_004342 [Aspergillus hancockii]
MVPQLNFQLRSAQSLHPGLQSACSVFRRTYVLRSADNITVNSQDDVTAAISAAEKASMQARNLQAATKSRIDSDKKDLSRLPERPYASLAALTKHLVQVAKGNEKPNFETLTKSTTDAFNTALQTTNRYLKEQGKVQAELTEQGAALAHHTKRLESAQRFLANEKLSQERRRNDAEAQKNNAQQRVQQATDKINELRRKIDNPWSDWKYKQAMEWAAAGIRDPRMRHIYGSDQQAQALLNAWNSEWKSNETQKGIYERDRNSAQSNYDDAVQRIRDIDGQLKETNNYTSKIAQESSRTNTARVDLQATVSSLIRIQGSLSKIHPALADMAAIAKETFRPRYHRTFGRSIMRILLLTPDLPAFNRCLGGVILMLETLPPRVLDGESDPDDYGTPELPLRGLLQEVQTLSRRRVN